MLPPGGAVWVGLDRSAPLTDERQVHERTRLHISWYKICSQPVLPALPISSTMPSVVVLALVLDGQWVQHVSCTQCVFSACVLQKPAIGDTWGRRHLMRASLLVFLLLCSMYSGLQECNQLL